MHASIVAKPRNLLDCRKCVAKKCVKKPPNWHLGDTCMQESPQTGVRALHLGCLAKVLPVGGLGSAPKTFKETLHARPDAKPAVADFVID
jgi:hypothetical protein